MPPFMYSSVCRAAPGSTTGSRSGSPVGTPASASVLPLAVLFLAGYHYSFLHLDNAPLRVCVGSAESSPDSPSSRPRNLDPSALSLGQGSLAGQGSQGSLPSPSASPLGGRPPSHGRGASFSAAGLSPHALGADGDPSSGSGSGASSGSASWSGSGGSGLKFPFVRDPQSQMRRNSGGAAGSGVKLAKGRLGVFLFLLCSVSVAFLFHHRFVCVFLIGRTTPVIHKSGIDAEVPGLGAVGSFMAKRTVGKNGDGTRILLPVWFCPLCFLCLLFACWLFSCSVHRPRLGHAHSLSVCPHRCRQRHRHRQ